MRIEFDHGEGRLRAAAHFTILSRDDSPEELADAIGMSPDDQWRRGDVRTRAGRPEAFNGIRFLSGLSENDSPSDHLSALVVRMESRAQRVRELGAKQGIRSMQVAVYESTRRDNVSIWVEPQVVESLARMGVELFVDAYFDASAR